MILERGIGLLRKATDYIFGPAAPEQITIAQIPANIEIDSSQVGPREHFVTEKGEPIECLVGDRFVNAAVALQRPDIDPPSFIQLLQALSNSPARHALSTERKNFSTQERSLYSDSSQRLSAFRGDKTFVSATTIEENHPVYQGGRVTTSVWYTDPTDVRINDTDMYCFGRNTVSVSVDHADGRTVSFKFEMLVDTDTFQIVYQSNGFQTQGGLCLESMLQPRVFNIQTGVEIFPPEAARV